MDRRTIGQRIRQAREAAGLSQEEVARRLGRSQSAMSDYERARLGLELPDLIRLAEILDQRISFFLNEESTEPERRIEEEIRRARQALESTVKYLTGAPPDAEAVKWVQSRGEVPAGPPADTIEVEYVPVPAHLLKNDDMFALTVRGDSMIGRGIRDGDRVIVNPSLSANDGDIVIARKDDEKVIRIYREDEDGLLLIAAARGYPRLRLEEATIIGVVTGWFRHNKE